jgi:hypothetical protein
MRRTICVWILERIAFTKVEKVLDRKRICTFSEVGVLNRPALIHRSRASKIKPHILYLITVTGVVMRQACQIFDDFCGWLACLIQYVIVKMLRDL